MVSACNKDDDDRYLMYYKVIYIIISIVGLWCNFYNPHNFLGLKILITHSGMYQKTIEYFDVDLEYPHELHDKHKNVLFCAEHRCSPGGKHKKLMTTLHNKEIFVRLK